MAGRTKHRAILKREQWFGLLLGLGPKVEDAWLESEGFFGIA